MAKKLLITRSIDTENLCERCGACDGPISNPKIEPIGSEHPVVYFVKGSIRSYEDETGVLCSDNEGRFLKRVLLECGFEKGTIRIGSVARCLSKKWDKTYRVPYEAQLKKCSLFMHKDILKVRPKIIIASGSEALKYLTGKTGITAMIGKVLPYIRDKRIPVFVTPDYYGSYSNDLMKDSLIGCIVKAADDVKNNAVKINNESEGFSRKILMTLKEVKDYYDRLRDEKLLISSDTETHGIFPYSAGEQILVASFSNDVEEGFTVPIWHKESPWNDSERNTIIKWTQDLYTDKDLWFLFHNAYFDKTQLRANLGVDYFNLYADTMVLSFFMQTKRGVNGLKQLAYEVEMGGYDDELDAYKSAHKECDPEAGGTYNNIPLDILGNYAAADPQCSLRYFKKVEPFYELPENKKIKSLAYNFMPQMIDVLSRVSGNGMFVDVEMVRDVEQTLIRQIDETVEAMTKFPEVSDFMKREIQLEMESIRGTRRKLKWEFKPGSTKQIGTIMQEYLNLPTYKMTDAGAYSTDDEVLSYYATKNPFCAKLKEYRTLKNSLSTFVDPLIHESAKGKKYRPMLINRNGCISSNFKPIGTETGRPSSAQPNLQNIPRQGPIRLFYVPRMRHLEPSVYLQLDLSQIELRVLAALCGDKDMCRVYRENGDLHNETVMKIYGVTPEIMATWDKVMAKENRVVAKKTNFGLVYGSGAKNLSEQLAEEGIERSVEECQAYINTFMKSYPGFTKWKKALENECTQKGYVDSPLGRRRYLQNLASSDKFLRSEALRQVVNSPIQGTASDLNIMNLILVERYIRQNKFRAKLNGIVHDSLTCECPISEIKDIGSYALSVMNNPVKNIKEHFPHFESDWLTVPVIADVEIGMSWASLKGVKDISKIEEEAYEIWNADKKGSVA